MEVNQHNTLLRNKNGTNSLDTRIHKVKTFRMQKTTKQKKYIYINKNHSPLQWPTASDAVSPNGSHKV